MNRKLITAACLALILAGCGDKDDSATGSAEPGMMDKAMESTSEMATDAADKAGEMAGEAADAVTDTAGDIAEGASEMASDGQCAAEHRAYKTGG